MLNSRVVKTGPNFSIYIARDKKKCVYIQSNLVSSTSLFSNNRLSRTVNLVPVLTWKSNNK